MGKKLRVVYEIFSMLKGQAKQIQVQNSGSHE